MRITHLHFHARANIPVQSLWLATPFKKKRFTWSMLYGSIYIFWGPKYISLLELYSILGIAPWLDASKLNQISRSHSFIPHINRIIGRFNKTKFWSKIDLTNAFWKILFIKGIKGHNEFCCWERWNLTKLLWLSELKNLNFGLKEITYIWGYVVNENDLKIDWKKLAPILDFPVPDFVQKDRRFLGMTDLA